MNKEEIIEMAREAQVHEELCGEHFIYEFAKLVAEHEREACAKIADELVGQDLEHNFSALIANNIRARGQE